MSPGGVPSRTSVARPVMSPSTPAGAALAALSHDVMAALDPGGRIVWANAAWLRVLGWAPDELPGTPLVDLLHHDDAAAGRALLRGGEAALRVRTRSGGVRRMAFGATAAPSDGVTYVCGRDASQTQELEHELRAAEDRFRAVTEATTSEAILIADARGRITFANTAACTMFGWEGHELLGQPFTMLVPERHREPHRATLRSSVSSGDPDAFGATVEVKGVRRDGAEFPIEVSLGSWERGGRRMFTAILRDVTERRATLRELERSNAELAEFAYVASHDLSEPLRMVSSYLQLLRRRHGDELSPAADEFVGHAVDGAMRMRALIEDLLAYSRAGRSELPAEPVDLDALVAAIAPTVIAAHAEPRPVIEWGELPTVPGEAAQLAQLLQNLISNGVKFVAAGTVPYVCVTAERDGACWRLAVEDNGIGIELRHAERIFGMFQRLHTREAYPGTGIGLAIARKVVERHGGRIWVECRPAGGTRFAFTLPA
jgi:PAS domain S-box-containing protein